MSRVVLLIVAVLATVGMAAISSDKVGGVPVISYCTGPGALLQDISVTFTPNDVKPGDKVRIELSGDLTQTVDQANATVSANVDGFIPLGPYNVDLCSLDKKVAICPLQAGRRNITHEVKIPSWLPSSSIVVNANVFRTSDGAQLVCFNATLSWS
jgi:hypothetical protein